MVQEENLKEQQGPITLACGKYSEIVKGRHRQEEVLRDFPWLWAIYNEWPLARSINVTNDTEKLIMLFRTLFIKMNGVHGIWMKVISESGATKVVELNLPSHFPRGKTTFGEIVKYHLPLNFILEHIVIMFPEKLSVYRHHKRGEPLQEILDEALSFQS